MNFQFLSVGILSARSHSDSNIGQLASVSAPAMLCPLSAPWASVPPIAVASVPLCGAWHSYLGGGAGVEHRPLFLKCRCL